MIRIIRYVAFCVPKFPFVLSIWIVRDIGLTLEIDFQEIFS
jgi:hypothetical protein